MTSKKLHRYLIILFALIILGSAFIVRYANSWLTTSSQELSMLKLEVDTLEAKRQGLEQAKITLADNKVGLSILDQAVPTDKDQARIVSELFKIADNANLTIASVGFPTSTLGQSTQAPTTTTPTPTTTTDAATGSSTPATTDTTQTTAKPAQSISQATPLKDIPGIQSIEVSLGALNSKTLPPGSGMRYSELLSFLRNIERNRRTIQVKSINIGQGTPVNGEAVFTLDVALSIFIRS
jgi:hypothetical protein